MPDLQRLQLMKSSKDPDLPQEVKDALRLRQSTSLASTKKLDAMAQAEYRATAGQSTR